MESENSFTDFEVDLQVGRFKRGGGNSTLFAIRKDGLQVPLLLLPVRRSGKIARFSQPGTESSIFIGWGNVRSIGLVKFSYTKQALRINLIEPVFGYPNIDIPREYFGALDDDVVDYLNSNKPDKFNSEEEIVSAPSGLKKLPPISIVLIIAVILGMGHGLVTGGSKSTGQHKSSRSRHYDKSVEKEAMSWATPSNPAIISNMEPESYRIEKWPSGRIKSKEPVVGGQLNGVAVYTFDNGKLYGKIPYLDGKKHGHFTLYAEDGSIDMELTYKNGKIHGIQTWHKLGQKWLYINDKAVRQLDMQSQP